MTGPVETDVPEVWQDAAEEVRAHLCALRVGGPFLSSADVMQLVQWFDSGVTVAAVLVALERAAEARRKSGRKVPLSIVGARRHLGRPVVDRFFRGTPSRDGKDLLGPVIRAMQLVPVGADARARAVLVTALARIERPGDDAVRQALIAVRQFFDAVWEDLGDDGRTVLRTAAADELGDLLSLVDEATAVELVEEGAREGLRLRYPALAAGPLTLLLGER